MGRFFGDLIPKIQQRGSLRERPIPISTVVDGVHENNFSELWEFDFCVRIVQ